MKTIFAIGAYGLAACLLAGFPPATTAADNDPATWNRKAAAAYMDQRADWWMKWPNASRDHDTFCVSCHTIATYAIARPALRQALAELGPSPTEIKLLDNVTKRVRMWKEVEPFYPDQTRGLPKTSESRGTEAVLNALILASRDTRSGALSDDGRRAFENLWALQLKTGELAGAWAWLNFHYEPWEAERSAYYGATLASIAVGMAPGGYAAGADIQDRLKLLREYLQRGNESQHLFNRVTLLWASAVSPGLLTREQQQAIIDAALRSQQADGGWSVATLGTWKRGDGTPLDTRSDGYGTGLVALALQAAGVPRDRPELRRGLAWLAGNQDASGGFWFAASLNKQRDPASDPGKFMSDAATAYAVLALTK
jgi:squalene-hopene/tetraprenyl-beta-curcumene cyclase